MSDTNGTPGAPHEQEFRRLFDFIAFTARLREIERPNNATPTRKESVAEHSWHLAVVSWILHAEFEREVGHCLDLTKMLKLCLMHDLVELDPDPDPDSSEDSGLDADPFASLPGALRSEFQALWHEYEEGRTPEACLVRGVDRLNPALMRYLTGQGWHDVPTDTNAAMDADALDRLQLPRVAVSETLRELYEEVRDASVRRGLLTPAPLTP
ncbi:MULTISPECIES: HD domain-containing protein [unclassified Streptomyces]|uniref:HD domain-containing protein n=1 Tax=unclassified Streptomyces TaxID=2593676 RepID=UPI00336A7557